MGGRVRASSVSKALTVVTPSLGLSPGAHPGRKEHLRVPHLESTWVDRQDGITESQDAVKSGHKEALPHTNTPWADA